MAQIKVTASMSRNYGPVTVSFTIEQSIDAKNAADIITANDSSIKALNIQFHDYETQYLPQLPVPSTKGIEGDTKPQGPKWYVAKEIYMSINNGKRYYFIRPGNEPKWTKYGAAVYFDRFEGLTQDEVKKLIDNDEFKHVFSPDMRVLIEIYKGKPRAIQIAHKDRIGEG